MLKTCLVFVLSLLSFWQHFGVQFVSPQNGTNTTTDSNFSWVHMGLVVDSNSNMGVMIELCTSMALWDFYSVHTDYQTKLVLHTKFSEDHVSAASSALDLLETEKVQTIMVALEPNEAKFVGELGEKAHVPVISLSTTSTPSNEPNPYFILSSQDDYSQVKAIANVVSDFGWREVVFLYEDSEGGTKFIPHMVAAFQKADTWVRFISAISTNVNDSQIVDELNKLMKMETRVFLVHVSPSLGSKLFVLAKKVGMMSEGYVWIITSKLSNLLNSMNSTVIDSMEGVLGIRAPYIPKSKNLESFKMRWKRNLHRMKPNNTTTVLNTFGLWAYDTTWALATAVERIGPMNFGFITLNNTRNSSSVMNLGISEVGSRLVHEILHTSFNGLSGEFGYLDGQLQTSSFEVFNIIGTGERIVGYWNLNKGTCREQYMKGSKNIIWPGDSMVKPIGWAIPTSHGNKLRIGVPYEKGISKEFVNVERIPDKNGSFNITGFSIDVFRAALQTLPFKVDFEFIPFLNDKNESAGTYNEMLHQIPNKIVDAVVGDVTIVAERTSYVDFTFPYVESGVIMVVRIKQDKHKSMWIFLDPFSWDLWLSNVAACVFIGGVVLILEHSSDDAAESDFSGPPHQKLGMLFWFPLSVVAFPERKMVGSNWSRFILVIWLFMTFILMQSYTANLSSILTVEQLQPVVPKNSYIGYQKHSFVKDLLLNRLKLDKNKLRGYETTDEYNDALSNGSQNGGVDAIYDEIPYMKLFLHKYPSKYMMHGPTYKTAGFGFAFPQGSRLVDSISKAILNVTQGDDMQKIEERYFGKGYSSQDHEVVPISHRSPSLGFYNFAGLYIIIGSVTMLALICSKFLLGHRCVALLKHYGQMCFPSSLSNRVESRVHSITEMNLIINAPSTEHEENHSTNSSQSDGIVAMQSEEEHSNDDNEGEIRS